MTVRVVIADDHAVVRRGTRSILEGHPDIEIVGEAGDGEAAVAMVARSDPDVVVLDLEMPGLNGLEASRRIKQAGTRPAVLILSVHDEDAYVVAAIKAGASGYLLKHVQDHQLVDGVLRVADGEAVLDASLTSTVVAALRSPIPTDDRGRPGLTPRQMDVLRAVARGLSNRETAATLGVSERTVEVHLTRIYKALGVGSRTEAVTSALRRRLIDLEGEV